MNLSTNIISNAKENSLFSSSDGAFKDATSTLGNTIIATVGVSLPVTPSIRLVL